MNKNYFLPLTLAVGCVAPMPGFAKAPQRPTAERPNIIFILADDLGYMDVGAFAHHEMGTPIKDMYYETPNLNRLSEQGLSFSSAYVCPLSSPTRSSLLTGKYAFSLGFTTAMPLRDTWYMLNEPAPEGAYIHDAVNHQDYITTPMALINGKSNSAIPAGLPIDEGCKEVLLSEALDGYKTAFVGKWHVGGFGAEGYQPKDRGFDEVLAYADAGGSTHYHWRGMWNGAVVGKNKWPNMPQKHWSFGDAGSEGTDEYLTDDLTTRAVDYIDRQSKADDGKPFFLYFCEFAIHGPIQSKGDKTYRYDKRATKGWNNHTSSTYAGIVSSLDDSVGRIMAKLEETGLDENTIIVFLSDNGGIDKKMSHSDDATDNSPFYCGKASVFEGGVKSPLIVWWGNNEHKGEWCDAMVDASDMFPTILDMAHIDPKPYYKEQKIDGRSFMSLLSDPENKTKGFGRNELYWHYPFNVVYTNPVDGFAFTPHSAMREGDLKLVFDWHGRVYLFNLKNDPYEKYNIAEQRPEETRRLFAKLVKMMDEKIEDRYKPTINEKYNPKKDTRRAPFVDLIKCYREGGDIMEVASFPSMSELVTQLKN